MLTVRTPRQVENARRAIVRIGKLSDNIVGVGPFGIGIDGNVPTQDWNTRWGNCQGQAGIAAGQCYLPTAGVHFANWLEYMDGGTTGTYYGGEAASGARFGSSIHGIHWC